MHKHYMALWPSDCPRKCNGCGEHYYRVIQLPMTPATAPGAYICLRCIRAAFELLNANLADEFEATDSSEASKGSDA